MSIAPSLLNNIFDSFEELGDALHYFDRQLSNSNLPISLIHESCDEPSKQGTMEKVRYHYTNIWHTDESDGRRTQCCYGLVGASSSLIEAAINLNMKKDQFRDSISFLKKSELNTVSARLHSRSGIIATTLNNQGIGRIHLKQCYRHIPLISSAPDHIRFSWYSSGRSIKKFTAEAAMQMLQKLDTSQPHIVKQIEKLSPLHKDTKLAQIQIQAPVVRANIAWKAKENNWRRLAKNCPLPILTPLLNGAKLPKHNELTSAPPQLRNRAYRSDSLIDPEPFLPSLRIHLYRK